MTLIMIPSIGSPYGLEVHWTQGTAARDAIEVTMTVADEFPGHYQRHTILIARECLRFFAEELARQDLAERTSP